MQFKIIDSDDTQQFRYQFRYGVEVTNIDEYLINPFAPQTRRKLCTWCTEMFGNNYQAKLTTFYFITEEDRTCFILRWS